MRSKADQSAPSAPTVHRGLAFTTALLSAAFLVCLAAAPARAQSSNDDLYGVPGSTAPVASPADSAASRPDSGADSLSTGSAVVAPVPVPIIAQPDTVKRAPRVRVTRETTINPLDTRRGEYRNPKKALFMSLIVPGLGQAYVGQTAFNYARAAFYFGTEATLGILWYQYTVVKYDREVKRYRRYADNHFSAGRYEDEAYAASAATSFKDINPYRTSYCEALINRESSTGAGLYGGCVNLLIPDSANVSSSYQNFRAAYDDNTFFSPVADPAGLSVKRSTFADPVEFYSLIGSYQEFIAGWDDAGSSVVYSDSLIAGTSAHRDSYNSMRDRAQSYSRMQAWFIGGLVINHIASALDAALTARRNNRILYEGEARWYDNFDVHGGLAFERGRPLTHLAASLAF